MALFGGKNRINISPNTAVALTTEGVKKAASMEDAVGDFGAVLHTLSFGNGCACSIKELSERTGIPDNRVADIVRTNRTFIMVKSAAD